MLAVSKQIDTKPNLVKIDGLTVIVLLLSKESPIPKAIISINGVQLHSQVIKHMITVTHNITKNVELVS